jgi:hypothetical protein
MEEFYRVGNMKCILSEQKFNAALSGNIRLVYLEEAMSMEIDSNTKHEPVAADECAFITFRYTAEGKLATEQISHASLLDTLNFIHNRYPVNPGDLLLQSAAMDNGTLLYEQCWNILFGATVYCKDTYPAHSVNSVCELLAATDITQAQLDARELAALLERMNTGAWPGKLKRVFIKANLNNPGLSALLFTCLQKMENPLFICIQGSPYSMAYTVLHELKANTDTFRIASSPVCNRELLVIDKYGNVQPIGLEGELCVKTGSGFFKTGTGVRRMEYGQLLLMRWNNRIAVINDQTVLLSDIDRCIMAFTDVEECITYYREDSESGYLYTLLKGEEPIDLKYISGRLFELLPEYLVPVRYITVSRLPSITDSLFAERDVEQFIGAHKRAELWVKAVKCDSDLNTSEISLMGKEMFF